MIKRLYHRYSLLGGALLIIILLLFYLGSFLTTLLVIGIPACLLLSVYNDRQRRLLQKDNAVSHGRKMMRSFQDSAKENKSNSPSTMYSAKISSPRTGLFSHASFGQASSNLPRVRRVQGNVAVET